MLLYRLLLFVLVVCLAVFSLTGCGASPAAKSPPAKEPYSSQAPEQEPVKSSEKTSKPADGAEPDNLTAKGVWAIIGPYAKEAVGSGGVPVFIWGKSAPEHPVAAGKASGWSAGFYAADQKAVWEVFYYSYKTANWEKGRPHRGKNPSYQEVTISVPDWIDDWKVDSPEACEIASQKGAKEIQWMRLQVRDLEVINKDFTVFKTPDFVSAPCKLYWVIQDKSLYEYYIDASTGMYLGSEHALVPQKR
ncbi:MAG: hypothetical protein AB1510_09115 [Bacillota bacterium]